MRRCGEMQVSSFFWLSALNEAGAKMKNSTGETVAELLDLLLPTDLQQSAANLPVHLAVSHS